MTVVASARRRAAVLTSLALGLVAALAPSRTAGGEPPAGQVDLRLKDGSVLRGRLVGSVREKEGTFDRVETDFGELRIPSAQVKAQEQVPPGGDAFVAEEVRILRLAGAVQRRESATAPWEALSDSADYARPAPRLRPGDTVRTGPDGTADLLLHRDAWVRVAPSSEIELATRGSAATLTLLRGTTVNDVERRPRGAEFRVRTPSALLGVRGTRFGVTVGETRERVAVLRGAVAREAGDAVEAGQAAHWGRGGAAAREELSRTDREALEIEVLRPPPDDLAYVPGGPYTMGSPPNVAADPDAAHGTLYSYAYGRTGTVQVRGFLIDRREVSREEYRRFQRATGRQPKDAAPLEAGTERLPASGMSLQEARAYAHWTGGDLPSASQWEAAARGPDGRTFPWGPMRSKAPLPAGTWIGGLPEGDITSMGWQPPARLPDVDAPTTDVSPFGVRAMVSSVPELVRPLDPDEPIHGLLSDNFKKWYLPSYELVRGVRGSVVGMIWRGSVPLPAGFRCVRPSPGG